MPRYGRHLEGPGKICNSWACRALQLFQPAGFVKSGLYSLREVLTSMSQFQMHHQGDCLHGTEVSGQHLSWKTKIEKRMKMCSTER